MTTIVMERIIFAIPSAIASSFSRRGSPVTVPEFIPEEMRKREVEMPCGPSRSIGGGGHHLSQRSY